MTRTETARQIRDRALVLVRHYGSYEAVGEDKDLTWRGAGFMVSYSTPLQRVEDPDAALKAAARKLGLSLEQTRRQLAREAREGLVVPQQLPYRLNIWQGRKVMNLEWSDDDALHIVSFRRGPWENVFLDRPTLSKVTPTHQHRTLQ